MVESLAGAEGLVRMFCDQELPIELLESPDTPAPMRDIVGLYQRAAEICSLRSLGLQASADIDVAQHGLMGQYVLQASSLRHALGNFRSGLPYYESGSELSVETVGDEANIGYRNIYQGIVGWRHAGDFTLCLIADIIRTYLGPEWKPKRIEVCYPPGSWEQDHEDIFGTSVHSGHDHIAIVIQREDLGRARNGRNSADDGLVSLADVRNMERPLPQTFPQVVADIIDSRLAYGAVDLEGTASKLCLGARTLQRQLEEHGLKYRDLVQRRRMRRARELLAEPEFGVGQIGRLVGYSATPQFTRAFKAHHDLSPQEFRSAIFLRKH